MNLPVPKEIAGGLREKGWNVYPLIITKVQKYPFAKCVVGIENGKVKKIIWSPYCVPKKTKEKFLKELDGILESL